MAVPISDFCFFHGNFMLLYHNLIMADCKRLAVPITKYIKTNQKATICQ